MFKNFPLGLIMYTAGGNVAGASTAVFAKASLIDANSFNAAKSEKAKDFLGFADLQGNAALKKLFPPNPIIVVVK